MGGAGILSGTKVIGIRQIQGFYCLNLDAPD
jgi:hypothetical protein